MIDDICIVLNCSGIYQFDPDIENSFDVYCTSKKSWPFLNVNLPCQDFLDFSIQNCCPDPYYGS